MKFSRIEPADNVRRLVECYWTVEDDDTTPMLQKIIPDGFMEIIFHFGDPYRINLSSQWELQARSLLAGQIKKHFYLENTGRSSILGIKLRPFATTLLFDVPVSAFTDRVPTLSDALDGRMDNLESELRSSSPPTHISLLDNYFTSQAAGIPVAQLPIERAVEFVVERRGLLTVAELCREINLGERATEKLFNKYVGLTPKFYARIIRFNYIFQLVKDRMPDWADIVYKAGYYDQSHFIRNFKTFTGEDPTAYMFEEKSLANFFLKKRS